MAANCFNTADADLGELFRFQINTGDIREFAGSDVELSVSTYGVDEFAPLSLSVSRDFGSCCTTIELTPQNALQLGGALIQAALAIAAQRLEDTESI
jgi:hypothetical protein